MPSFTRRRRRRNQPSPHPRIHRGIDRRRIRASTAASIVGAAAHPSRHQRRRRGCTSAAATTAASGVCIPTTMRIFEPSSSVIYNILHIRGAIDPKKDKRKYSLSPLQPKAASFATKREREREIMRKKCSDGTIRNEGIPTTLPLPSPYP